MVKTSKISSKKATVHTQAALNARFGARKVAKKRSSAKAYKLRWLALKLRLADAQTRLTAALLADDIPRQEVFTLVVDKVLAEMRTFADYRFTDTGKKNGLSECLGFESGVDVSSVGEGRN
jgi:hypothetical protein